MPAVPSVAASVGSVLVELDPLAGDVRLMVGAGAALCTMNVVEPVGPQFASASSPLT